MNILVTGGLGYIGSHTIVKLLENNYNVICIDNLCNSNEDVIEKIKKITSKDFKFYYGDVNNKDLLTKIFKENKIDSVIHFAGLKAVGESVKYPLKYYKNNLNSTITLLEVMTEFNVNKIVFSSSATVYGKQEILPIKEDSTLHTTNPYGTTKLVNEMILKDETVANPNMSVVILRYFNPIGGHESGILKENPKDTPNNLMP